MTAHDDRARNEQPAPTARETAAGEQGCQETDTATEGMSHNRDMADTREISADELAEAERYVRRVADENDDGDLLAVLRFLAEALRTELGRLDRMYDERGRERDAARAEVERLRQEVAELEIDHTIDHDMADELSEELHEAEDTLAQIRSWFDLDDESSTGWVSAIEQQARELEQLRARDEAAKAVVQYLGEHPVHLGAWFADTPFGKLLDALARAHEAQDGGRDR